VNNEQVSEKLQAAQAAGQTLSNFRPEKKDLPLQGMMINDPVLVNILAVKDTQAAGKTLANSRLEKKEIFHFQV
jgi:hypothetical protein